MKGLNLKFILFFLLLITTVFLGCEIVEFEISGTITDDYDNPLSGVEINLAGDSVVSTVTDENGAYLFTSLGSGSYTVTPQPEEDRAFQPESREVIIQRDDVGGIDFVGIQLCVPEKCYDGIDNNCDGNVDEDCTITNSLGMEFNLIPSGTFIMGSPESELGRSQYETQHEVELTQDFYMQTTEVTQAQWEAVMGEGTNPSYNTDCGANCPVECIRWWDTIYFCNQFSILEGLTPYYYSDEDFTMVYDRTAKANFKILYCNPGANGYRLPTEAQWEYAARSGSTTAFANGEITVTSGGNDPVLDLIGWYANHPEKTGSNIQEVAQLISNAWGLYDMHGNVLEWCKDAWSVYPTGPVVDPEVTFGQFKVVRGGSGYNHAQYCRSADRPSGNYADDYNSATGFRVALPHVQ